MGGRVFVAYIADWGQGSRMRVCRSVPSPHCRHRPAQGEVDPRQSQYHFLGRFRLSRFGGRLAEQVAAPGELASPAAIGEQPVMAQPGEAARKHMQQEATDEHFGVEPYHLDLVAIGVVAPAEAYVLAVEVDEAVVGDGGLVGVAPGIGQDVLGAGERGLGVDHPVVDHPVVGSQRGLQAVELATVVPAAGDMRPKLAVAVRGVEEVEILAAEDLGQRGSSPAHRRPSAVGPRGDGSHHRRRRARAGCPRPPAPAVWPAPRGRHGPAVKPLGGTRELHQVQGRRGGARAVVSQVQVAHGRADATVPEAALNDVQLHPRLLKPSGVAMTQRVDSARFLNPGLVLGSIVNA